MKKIFFLLITILVLGSGANAQFARWKFNNDVNDASVNAINGTATRTPYLLYRQ